MPSYHPEEPIRTADSESAAGANALTLELRKLELERYKVDRDYRKFVLGSVFAAIAIAAIPPLFQLASAALEYVKSQAQLNIDNSNRQAERLAKEEEFQEGYIKDFLKTALDQDIELRIRFAEYFASVSADTVRRGWETYRDELKTRRDTIRKDILQMETELQRAPQGSNAQLELKLDWAYKEVGYIPQNRSIAQSPRVVGATSTVPLSDPKACEKLLAVDFKGRAILATEDDFQRTAGRLNVDIATLRALLAVETSGVGFLSDGRPKMLFERTVFHRLTSGQYSETNPEISSETLGGYGPAGAHQYDRLKQAISLDCGAALASASWGIFQLTGSQAHDAGFNAVDEMVLAYMDSEGKQFDAFSAFILARDNMLSAIRRKDWADFARYFNGPNFAANNYDGQLQHFYSQYASESDKDDLRQWTIIRGVQMRLAELGFGHGPIDGVLGDGIRVALENFQRSEGLSITGRMDKETLTRLGISIQ